MASGGGTSPSTIVRRKKRTTRRHRGGQKCAQLRENAALRKGNAAECPRRGPAIQTIEESCTVNHLLTACARSCCHRGSAEIGPRLLGRIAKIDECVANNRREPRPAGGQAASGQSPESRSSEHRAWHLSQAASCATPEAAARTILGPRSKPATARRTCMHVNVVTLGGRACA